jgi:hypothetical protein
VVIKRYGLVTSMGIDPGGRVSVESRTEFQQLTALAALIRQVATAANEAATASAPAAWLALAETNVELAARHQRARLRGRYGQSAWWVSVVVVGGAAAVMAGCVYGAQVLDMPRWGISAAVLCGQIVVALPSIWFGRWLDRRRLCGALPSDWPQGADGSVGEVLEAVERAREMISELLAGRLGTGQVSAELLQAAYRRDTVLERPVVVDSELCGVLHAEPQVVGS